MFSLLIVNIHLEQGSLVVIGQIHSLQIPCEFTDCEKKEKNYKFG